MIFLGAHDSVAEIASDKSFKVFFHPDFPAETIGNSTDIIPTVSIGLTFQFIFFFLKLMAETAGIVFCI